MKSILTSILLFLSCEAFSENTWCGDTITRVQIENGVYVFFLQPESGSVTVHNIGKVGEPLFDRYYSMALTAYATGDEFIIRYTNPSTSVCSDLRWEDSKITYITLKK